ncbi:MAG: hypothetical protein ACR2MX_12305 [Cyclobacteriaceae bacterium]
MKPLILIKKIFLTFALAGLTSQGMAQDSEPLGTVEVEYGDPDIVEADLNEMRLQAGNLYSNLNNLQQRYLNALRDVKDLMTKSDSDDGGSPDYSSFFFNLLVNNLIKEAEAKLSIPGMYALKNTIVAFMEEGEKGETGRNLRAAHEWVETEIEGVEDAFDFVHEEKLEDLLVNQYFEFKDPGARRQFIENIDYYNASLGRTVPSAAQAELDVLERYISDSYNEDGRHSQGVLYGIIQVDDNASSGLEVHTQYGKEIGRKLNILLPKLNLMPFDLNVYKLLIFDIPGCYNCDQEIWISPENEPLNAPASYNASIRYFEYLGSCGFRTCLGLRSFRN